ncbi:bifunctional 2-C-methyl-D-erythritol 4-phosphate cytidylyltransferase/2-C-methyl-D-erythritol 2,4-cyclodiphosphate synthase [Sphingomonas sp.]|uniref:bifunctional 2-C-methyl-D-erythritol 4-phosphate cytidylyltransferase/2-C-methyl-D-erythritol 2,4-cyclodiphosphate synthase n=1 Tax=Sphingomonas sp. TaxID=28214 RepID=UPI00180B6170|nr:bifunctional 2-C-methyl-D-erythritol 4-phosphate cytidylyltransferase/2-C-methyl-D-erythritol 2,4-cyclodiphosphate synthase [Sphingomonas sp.]MBA3510590.1 bifunctional 2-C-methyl-D-erythritol 4-phosphate cytidylyltransferase/2-C-methyl-D-erythritol 2,4-cyclodiphosphate synthase [Sphingomonas sp.]
MTVTALIVAAGSGERLGGGIPKQYRPLGGKPVLRRAVEAFAGHPLVDAVRVVIGVGHDELAAAALEGVDVGEPIRGGARRADSVRAGLAECAGEQVLVHDAARPFCPPQVIDRLLRALGGHDGAAPVLPVDDTLARAQQVIGEPIDRAGAVRVQTPQAFGLDGLRRAYERWQGEPPTDETSVARAAGLSVAAVEGDPLLGKLTTAADWDRAEAMLAARLVSRTGMGFDVHGFAGDGPMMLGGIAVRHSRGLAGHSDADVVLHAITDALLGAAGLGDIGDHFPPSDAQWRGAPSDRFLAHAAELIRARGGIIDHVDCTVIAEEPRVGPHRAAMRARIAAILGLDPGAVSIKATTTEGLGFTGRREGIAAQAVASIRMEPAR